MHDVDRQSALTRLTLVGRAPERHGGSVSPPVERTSTRVFASLAQMEAAHSTGVLSDFLGSETPRWLEQAVAELEGPDAVALATGTGMSALVIVFLSVLEQGDHMLMPDTVFWPTRKIAEGLLRRLGISVSYYDPLIAGRIDRQLRPETKLVLTESPGSNTFEVQDVPAIAAAAHEAGVAVAIDNSWATPLCFRPLEHGVDYSISAVTKYMVGHSDTILGAVATRPRHLPRLRETANLLGDGCSPDDAFLALRGLRTLGLRLRQHEDSALRVARWLAGRAEVQRVLHPALPSCPGHDVWARDFSGSTGLFSVLFRPLDRRRLELFVEGLRLFKLGYSWGGFESLVLPIDPSGERTVVPWTEDGTLIRFNVGLEDPDDLVADLEQALDRVAAVGVEA